MGSPFLKIAGMGVIPGGVASLIDNKKNAGTVVTNPAPVVLPVGTTQDDYVAQQKKLAQQQAGLMSNGAATNPATSSGNGQTLGG